MGRVYLYLGGGMVRHSGPEMGNEKPRTMAGLFRGDVRLYRLAAMQVWLSPQASLISASVEYQPIKMTMIAIMLNATRILNPFLLLMKPPYHHAPSRQATFRTPTIFAHSFDQNAKS